MNDSFKIQQVENHNSTTDAMVLQELCLQREQHIFQIRILLCQIQDCNSGVNESDHKISELKNIILQVQLFERSAREKERIIVNKYFTVRTDMHFQKEVLYKVLEGVLENYKKLMGMYEKNQMMNDLMAIRYDVDSLKKNLRDFVSAGRASVPEVIQSIISFSRQRVDFIVDQAEQKQFFRDLINKKILKRVTLKSSSRKAEECKISNRSLKINQSDINYASAVDKTKPKINSSQLLSTLRGEQTFRVFGEQSKPNSRQTPRKDMRFDQNIGAYYQGIFKKQVKLESTQLLAETGISADRHDEKFLKFSIQKNTTKNIIFRKSTQQDSSIRMSSQIKESLSMNLRKLSPHFDPRLHVSAYESTAPIHVNDNIYQELQTRTIGEKDQSIQLYKLFKEMMKANLSIYMTVGVFRRNFMGFLNKQADMQVDPYSQKKNRTRDFWVKLLDQKEQQEDRIIGDLKDINKIMNSRNQNVVKKKIKSRHYEFYLSTQV